MLQEHPLLCKESTMRSKKNNKEKKGMAAAKVKARPGAKRLADRKADVKAPSARARKGAPRGTSRRARGTGK